MSNQYVIQRNAPPRHPKLKKWSQRFKKLIGLPYRILRNKKMQRELKDIEFSIMSMNCLGGVFLHDVGKRFNSPTVNLSFNGPDYVKFLENMDYYLGQELVFENSGGEHPFPVAKLDDIEIWFVHYKTQEECVELWEKRKSRIIKEHIYIVATDNDGFIGEELLERFDKLQYPKVYFTARNDLTYDWAVHVPAFRGRNQVYIMTEICGIFGKHYYETCFDMVKWIKDNY